LSNCFTLKNAKTPVSGYLETAFVINRAAPKSKFMAAAKPIEIIIDTSTINCSLDYNPPVPFITPITQSPLNQSFTIHNSLFTIHYSTPP
jgi:hypothetical protein